MTPSRRGFLSGGGAAMVALASTGALVGRAMAAPKPVGIGLQLYTVREIFQRDPVGTLEKVAKVGYRELEYAAGGYLEMDHAMLRKAMDRLGLTAPSVQVGYDDLIDRLDATVAMANTLGADAVVLGFMGEPHRTAPAWAEAVANFNRFAEKLKKAGLTFAYHNHDFEFTTAPDGVSLFDRLLKDRDPALVRFELDLYWATKGGQDPRKIIRRLGGQVYSYHAKDMKPDGSMAAVGAGTIDFASIFKLDAVSGVRHIYVENDQAPAPYIPDITTSFRNLRTLRANV
jgi:sugar phosphate isomerase/epimerase